MKGNNTLRKLFLILALLLSHVMCAVVGYSYQGMLCAIAHQGASASAYVAFFYAIPFGVGIVLCILAAFFLRCPEK